MTKKKRPIDVVSDRGELKRTGGQRSAASTARTAAPIVTRPPPATLKGRAKRTLSRLQGQSVNMLLDKLGERLAFERTGVRLYDALLAKLEADGSFPGGPVREDLERIRHEEGEHFIIVTTALEELGADPTAVTPCANVTAVASMGLLGVLGDPRTTLSQALHAIHIAELTDNDGWRLLVDLAEHLGNDELAARLRVGLFEEEQHLALVRAWVEAFAFIEADPRRAAEGAASPDPR